MGQALLWAQDFRAKGLGISCFPAPGGCTDNPNGPELYPHPQSLPFICRDSPHWPPVLLPPMQSEGASPLNTTLSHPKARSGGTLTAVLSLDATRRH